jgi:hypothetical protein
MSQTPGPVPPPEMAGWPAQTQIKSAFRYAGTAVGAIATMGAALGVLSPEQSAALVADVHAVIDDLTQLFGDVWKLVLLVLPVATFWLAKMGWNSASPKAQIASVQAMPQANVVVTDPKLAEGIPGVKVVSPAK